MINEQSDSLKAVSLTAYIPKSVKVKFGLVCVEVLLFASPNFHKNEFALVEVLANETAKGGAPMSAEGMKSATGPCVMETFLVMLYVQPDCRALRN